MSMGDGPYRGSSDGPTRVRVEAEASIAACEGKVTPAFPVFVPRDLWASIEQLRKVGEAGSDDDRVRLADALEDAVSRVEERETDLRDIPDDHPDGPPNDDLWGPAGTETVAEPILMRVHNVATDLDRKADVTRTGPRITARILARDTPVLWSVHLSGEIQFKTAGDAVAFARSSHWIGARVADDTPRVFLRREGIADTVLKALNLRTEAEIDDEVFDDMFFIEADARFAAALFTRPLREALVHRAIAGDFTFLLDGGTASLAWKSDLLNGLVSDAVIEPSVDALAELRSSLRKLPLVRR